MLITQNCRKGCMRCFKGSIWSNGCSQQSVVLGLNYLSSAVNVRDCFQCHCQNVHYVMMYLHLKQHQDVGGWSTRDGKKQKNSSMKWKGKSRQMFKIQLWDELRQKTIILLLSESSGWVFTVFLMLLSKSLWASLATLQPSWSWQCPQAVVSG